MINIFSLNEEDKHNISSIITKYDYKTISISEYSGKQKEFLSHYVMNNDDKIFKENDSYQIVRDKYQNLIDKDVFLDMTLTYDYDNMHLNDLGKELLFNVQ